MQQYEPHSGALDKAGPFGFSWIPIAALRVQVIRWSICPPLFVVACFVSWNALVATRRAAAEVDVSTYGGWGGTSMVPSMAGGINFGSWWVSLELLCGGELPLPPLELTPRHQISSNPF